MAGLSFIIGYFSYLRVAFLVMALMANPAHSITLDTYDLGLSDFSKINLIHAATKDKDGFYWLGTEVGLFRYDGRQLVKIHSDKSMPLYNLPVSRLKIQGNKIWVGTTSGLYFINLDDYSITPIEPLASLYIWSISIDQDDVLITTNKSGVFRLLSQSESYVVDEAFLQRQRSQRIVFNRDSAMMGDSRVWLSHPSGLHLYDITNSKLTSPKGGLQYYPGDLSSIAADNIKSVKNLGDRLYVVTDRYLYSFDSSYKLVTKVELPCYGDPSCSFLKLQVSSAGTVWGRINFTKLAKVDHTSQSINVVSNVQSLYISDLSMGEDDELLYFGQNTMAAARVEQSLYDNIDLDSLDKSLSNFMPSSFQQDAAGNIWLNDSDVLLEFNPSSKAIKRYTLSNSPYTFEVDSDKNIWSHDSKSMSIIRFNSTNQRTDSIGSHDVNSIINSPHDGLWIIDTQYNVHRYDKVTGFIKSYPNSFCTDSIKRVYPRIVDRGLLAWSGDGYLCRYNREFDRIDQVKIEGKQRGEFSERVFYANERYWVLSPAIEYYDYNAERNSLVAHTFDKLDNIQLDFNSQVIGQRYIWALNQAKTRLYRINTENERLSFYNLSEGVPRVSASSLLGVINDQKLIFAEPGKISILDVAQLDQIPLDSSLKVHHLSIFSKQGVERKRFHAKASLKLPYTDDAVEISFGSSRPKDGVKEFIYYRLKGSSDTWIKTHRGFARFSGLSPGSYVFEIKDSIDEENQQSLAITVEAPPWLRWWAYLIYISIIVAVLLFFLIQRIRYLRRLNYLASFDSLSNLPNRHTIVEHMQKLARRKAKFSILFIDLDRFKHVNDSLGHQLGDQLLVQLAEQLQSALSAEQLISRLGGDEFLVVCQCAGNRDNTELCAQRLIDTINKPITLDKKQLHLSLSIGLAQFPSDASTVALLMARADAAMYEAKSKGGNAWCWYSDALGEASLKALDIESRLFRALKNEEFVPFYQAKYDTAEKKYVGYEALVRWRCPTQGLISPLEFIATAEKTGSIVDISWLLLHQVCQQLEYMYEKSEALPIAVNVSAKQLMLDDFADKFRDLIGQYNFDPKLVELEVTESMLLDNSNNAIKQLKILKLLGHKIYIDDFGTGYSSLAYLKQLPIHALKIDLVFVKDILSSEQSKDIVSAIIFLAKKMNLEVIAEGVETFEVAQLLQDMGCNIVQGFCFCVPSDQIRSCDDRQEAQGSLS